MFVSSAVSAVLWVSLTWEEVEGEALPTMRTSDWHGLFAGWLIESPEYEACQ